MNCPHCAEPLAERGVFCKACAGQARCTKCREILEPGGIACVECGTRVGQAVEGANGTANQPVLAATRNTIRYREDKNSRDLFADLSDHSMASVGEILAEALSHRNAPRIHHTLNQPFPKEGSVIEVPKGIAPPQPSEPAGPSQPDAPEPTPDFARVASIFRANGETLELIEHRLKAKSGMNYVRRLTYLFLYAHELHGRHWTPQAQLFAILKDGKVLDANARSWLKKKQNFRVDSDDRFQLIQAGRDEAKQALGEALDPTVQDEWNPDKKTVTKRAARKKKA